MKKSILICLVGLFMLAGTQTTQAQTKEETIAWIKEKMMKKDFWRPNRRGELTYHIPEMYATRVDFDDNYLYLNIYYLMKEEHIRLRQKPDVTEKTHTDYYRIDLSKLDTGDILYGRIETKGNYIRHQHDYGETKYKNGLDSYINPNCESDILERLKKAMEHYISLMTVKKSNETF